MKKALFLDRDGVVNVDHGYLYQAEKFDFIPGVFEACRRFAQAGYAIVIVTNQSGIGRGYYSEQDFAELTRWMIQAFAKEHVTILDVMYCPHHPTDAQPMYLKDCDCRKPAPGMLLEAINKHQLDPKSSIMVGDKSSDMQAAINAGVGAKYLVLTGKTISESGQQLADATYADLLALASEVLA